MKQSTEKNTLSVIVPCFNEAQNLEVFLDRLSMSVKDIDLGLEFIFVDDGSEDGTASLLEEASAQDQRVKALILSRNFGKEVALSAGLQFAVGDCVVCIDADLQHPPELLPAMIEKWHEGFDTVIAVRQSRETDPLWRRIASNAFFTIFNRLSDTQVQPGSGDFRLLDRKVVDSLNRMPEKTRFLKGMYSWVGFKQVTIPFEVDHRLHGNTSFSALSLIKYSIEAVTSFSTFPIRVWTYLGLSFVVTAIFYGIYAAINTFIHGNDAPGFASLLMMIVLFGGLQILTLGVIGEYIGRILIEVKNRPLFLVQDSFNMEANQESKHRQKTTLSTQNTEKAPASREADK